MTVPYTRRMLVGFALALSALSARVAAASITFPDTVKDEWQLPGGAPACTLCHQTLDGGFGTATKPFGRAVLANGATAVDTGALRRALRALEAAGSDVDHDGMTDIAELQMGADPDVFDDYGVDAGTANESFDDFPVPQTGCSVVAVGALGARSAGLPQSARLTGPRPSPTVRPSSGADAMERFPARRNSGDAFLVCGLILGAVLTRVRRLRVQRKRMASTTR